MCARKVAALVSLYAMAVTLGFGGDRVKRPETPHLEFVTEYVRELASIESIRAGGEREASASKEAGNHGTEVFSIGIRNSTLMQLELGSQIRRLKAMRLDPPHEDVIKIITDFYKQKIELHQQLIDIASVFLIPKEGVDYAEMAAELPKIRAGLEFVDGALFAQRRWSSPL